MPELPEVETVVRSLRRHVAGCRVLTVEVRHARAAGGDPGALITHLTGRRIVGLQRTGKHILFVLDQGMLDVHLRMTGKLLWQQPAGPHARAILTLDRGTLIFDDIRQFGQMIWREGPPETGPDALRIAPGEFAALLRSHRGAAKPLLLNQQHLAGLGNIYTDEILFRAAIHPRARAATLSRARVQRLYDAMHEVLADAIQAGGSTISDYVDSAGRAGSFQLQHRVYQKTGEPCPVCGTPVRRIVVAQRGTHFCPRCQKH